MLRLRAIVTFVAAVLLDGCSGSYEAEPVRNVPTPPRFLLSATARDFGVVACGAPAPMDQGGPRWSPDGRAIAGWSHMKEEGALFVVRRDSSGGWGPAAWRLPKAQLPQWSPDGRVLAFVRYDGSIALIPAEDLVDDTAGALASYVQNSPVLTTDAMAKAGHAAIARENVETLQQIERDRASR